MTFDVIDPDLILGNTLSPPENDELYLNQHSNFVNTGYDQLYTVSNMGITFVILFVMVLISLCLFVTKKLRSLPPKIEAKRQNMLKSLYWNSYIRFIIEGTLEIFISTIINIRYLYESGTNPFDDSQGGMQFKIINTCTLIVLFIIISVSPIAIGLFYFLNKEKWCFDEEEKCDEEKER